MERIDCSFPGNKIAAAVDMGHSPEAVMLQFENSIRVIERSGYTGRNSKPDGRELFRDWIVNGCTGIGQSSRYEAEGCTILAKLDTHTP